MDDPDRLAEFLRRNSRVTVLTGAGCSAPSGIPVYRADDGGWKHARPIQYGDFMASATTRRRYWARSFAGWQKIAAAEPNAAHRAIAALEAAGHVQCVITQNVDGLHSRAGSRAVIDLHGRLATVSCRTCGERLDRNDLQHKLLLLNPSEMKQRPLPAPDGDAQLADDAVDRFRIADCERCSGVLKPDVVFFGENVPRARLNKALQALAGSDALLVVGSSLMVYSGFRFVRLALEDRKPVAVLNRGRTRADDLPVLRLHGLCQAVLPSACDLLRVAAA